MLSVWFQKFFLQMVLLPKVLFVVLHSHLWLLVFQLKHLLPVFLAVLFLRATAL